MRGSWRVGAWWAAHNVPAGLFALAAAAADLATLQLHWAGVYRGLSPGYGPGYPATLTWDQASGGWLAGWLFPRHAHAL